MPGDLKATADALFQVEFDHHNISRALETCKPLAVQQQEQALKEAKEKAKAEALVKSPEEEAIAWTSAAPCSAPTSTCRAQKGRCQIYLYLL